MVLRPTKGMDHFKGCRPLSVAQIRGARGLLGWSQTTLANAAGLSEPTIKRYETGRGARVSDAAVGKMAAALETAGVAFIEENGGGPGVRLKKPRPDPDSIAGEDLNASNDE
jgi:transcriptional regulator with XRE-family HTH domain